MKALRIAALVGVVLVVLVAGACGGDDGDDESADTTAATTTTAPTTTLDEETQKEEAATAAYLAYWATYVQATADPVDPELPAMQRLITADHQRVVTRNLQDRQARGEAVRHPAGSQATHEIRSAELQADGSVMITECEVDDAVVYMVATGSVVNDEVVTKLATAVMVEVDGSWRIAHSEVIQRWRGVVECAA